MATIYHGRDKRGRDLAIKVIRRAYSKQGQFIKRFQRECETTSRLKHPNIVELIDHGVDEDVPFYAMEYLPFDSMEDFIKRGDLFPEEELLDFSRQVFSAFHCYHQEALVHRDIKPSNVILKKTKDRRVPVIVDFGLVLDPEQTALTETGDICGTPAYLPPELLEGKKADIRSDIYQWGIVLYEASSGKLPIGEVNYSEAIARIISGRFTPIEVHCPNISMEFSSLLSQCMAHSPQERFRTPKQALQALDTLKRRRRRRSFPSLSAKHSAIVKDIEEPARKKRRRRSLSTLLSLGLLLVLAYSCISIFQQSSMSEPPRPIVRTGFTKTSLQWRSKAPLETKATIRDHEGRVLAVKRSKARTTEHVFIFSLLGHENADTIELSIAPDGPSSLSRKIRRKDFGARIQSLTMDGESFAIELKANGDLPKSADYSLVLLSREQERVLLPLTLSGRKSLRSAKREVPLNLAEMKVRVFYKATKEKLFFDLEDSFRRWADGMIERIESISSNEIITEMVVKTSSIALEPPFDRVKLFRADGTFKPSKLSHLSEKERARMAEHLRELQTWAQSRDWAKKLIEFAQLQKLLLSSSIFSLKKQFLMCKKARMLNILNHCFKARNWLPFCESSYHFGPYWNFSWRKDRAAADQWRLLKDWKHEENSLLLGNENTPLFFSNDSPKWVELEFHLELEKLERLDRALICLRLGELKRQLFLLMDVNHRCDYVVSKYMRKREKGSNFFYQYVDKRALKVGTNYLKLDSRVYPGFFVEDSRIKVKELALYLQ